MGRYRKKPVEVEAVQFRPDTEHRFNLPDGVEGVQCGGADNWNYDGCTFWIETEESTGLPVDPFDWIIREKDGSYHPCKPDIFEATYEPVDLLATQEREGNERV